MSNNPVFELAGIAALLPLAVAGTTGRLRAGPQSWMLLAAALVGGSLPAMEEFRRGWSTGLGPSLDVSVLALLAMFAVTTLFLPVAVRLAGLVAPYSLLLLILGWMASVFEPVATASGRIDAWFAGHVLFAIASYGALTLAALCAAAMLLLESALKARVDSWAGRVLAPLDVIEVAQNGMLKASAALMFLALITGGAKEYLVAGQMLAFTHKILLSFLAFLVVCLVLFMHHRTGLRGRRAARWLLTGFLLLTLAYPGVKFVREFLIA